MIAVCEEGLLPRETPSPSSSTTKQTFDMVGGLVPFYADEMANSDSWLRHENHVLDVTVIDTGLLGSHMCSYLCWTSGVVGDTESRCYFRDDSSSTLEHVPPEAVCQMTLLDRLGRGIHTSERGSAYYYNSSVPVRARET